MANRFFACPQGSLLPKWVVIWLVVSTVLCVMDVFYTMMRPMTNRGGGVLATLYEPWNIYADVDYRYADKADLVTMATGRVMTIEIVMNIAAIFMNNRQSRHTVLTVFTSSAFVFWKTVWYMVLYIRQPEGTPEFINPEASLLRQIIVFWIADGVWVIAPLLVMIALWDRLAKNDYSECHAPEDCDEEEITKKSLSSAESSS
ncbi:hypothetical protein PFISCL1PPCAC_5220 [Pristionchus fissidentatus]|uniref:G protein-coupled receptor n=1 Tax=Pristionchus fissidentatus TaxID=1538716 RepID=A0AAV5V474_9BILA|nr:hypothetical protein PFISCL1PPCAC_5220 [Pristionchus fissidentatus]